MVFVAGTFCAENTCTLPIGTESDGAACDNGEDQCTIAVLRGASELSCTTGYNGSPLKANAVCDTSGGAFTLSPGSFCTGLKLPPTIEILLHFYLCIHIVVLLLVLSTENGRYFLSFPCRKYVP